MQPTRTASAGMTTGDAKCHADIAFQCISTTVLIPRDQPATVGYSYFTTHALAYQTHWVNKRIGVPDSAVPVPAPMSPLNAPDSPTWPDCQLRTPRSQP